MKITLIAAVDDKNGIGKNNFLPWKNSDDMRHFREYTTGKVVLMGSRTWGSLPTRPLNDRTSWVLCSTPIIPRSLARSFMCVEEVLSFAKFKDECNLMVNNELCVIGGQSVYEQFMPHATNIILTKISGDYGCDRFFPVIDNNWQLVKTERKLMCSIEYYERVVT